MDGVRWLRTRAETAEALASRLMVAERAMLAAFRGEGDDDVRSRCGPGEEWPGPAEKR